MENKFDTGDLFTNEENYRGKTPSGEFKVTTPENPLLSKLVFNPRNARDHLKSHKLQRNLCNKIIFQRKKLL